MSSEPMKCEITGKDTMIGAALVVTVKWGETMLVSSVLDYVSPEGMLRAAHYFTLGLKPPSRKNPRVKKSRDEKKAV